MFSFIRKEKKEFSSQERRKKCKLAQKASFSARFCFDSQTFLSKHHRNHCFPPAPLLARARPLLRDIEGAPDARSPSRRNGGNRQCRRSSSRRSDDDDDECKRRFHHHRFLAPSPRRRVYLRLRLRVLSQGRLHRARGRRPLRQDDAVREARRQAQGERGED